VQKCTSGLGIFAAGLILSLTHFPADALPGAVPAETIDRLILVYACVITGLPMLAALVFSRFPFGRIEHEARLARLAEGEIANLR
jgi:GPH family glycoside/pentoside/hexuronide:cation symporter